MKSKKAKFLIQVLEDNAFIFLRQKGSHIIYKKENIIVIVPYHGSNKEIPLGTFLNIIRQSKLNKDLFEF